MAGAAKRVERMSRRRIGPLLLVGLVVAAGLLGYWQIHQTDRFDKQFNALTEDLQTRLIKAFQEHDTAPAVFDYLEREAPGKLAALPPASQQYQEVLVARLSDLLKKSVELNKTDPLTAQSQAGLTQLMTVLQDIRDAHHAGAGFKPMY
ncbi:MAG: hypothetical protein HUU35_17880 [Armatimonadetes bacterium]|nr:hypothetical protein [Armatimonadota bacterium]